jgi:hypothetical protein
MIFDDVKSLAQAAGIQQGIDEAWIGLEQEMADFAELVEKRALNRIFKKVPDAWLVLDKTTGEPVRLSITEPGGTWLAECYTHVPLYRP